MIAGDRVRLIYADTYSWRIIVKARGGVIRRRSNGGLSPRRLSRARRHGLNVNMVFFWRGDLRFGAGRYATAFFPVEVAPIGVSVPAEPVCSASDSRIEIALASGHRLTLSGAFDPDMVVRLARGLSA